MYMWSNNTVNIGTMLAKNGIHTTSNRLHVVSSDEFNQEVAVWIVLVWVIVSIVTLLRYLYFEHMTSCKFKVTSYWSIIVPHSD